jgi:hypothetical protein
MQNWTNQEVIRSGGRIVVSLGGNPRPLARGLPRAAGQAQAMFFLAMTAVWWVVGTSLDGARFAGAADAAAGGGDADTVHRRRASRRGLDLELPSFAQAIARYPRFGPLREAIDQRPPSFVC